VCWCMLLHRFGDTTRMLSFSKELSFIFEELKLLPSLHDFCPSSQHTLDRKPAKETRKILLSNDRLTPIPRKRLQNQHGRQRSPRRQKGGPQEAQQQSRPRQRAHKERHFHSHKDRSWQSRCWRKRCSEIRYAREESSRVGRFCFVRCKEADPECADSFGYEAGGRCSYAGEEACCSCCWGDAEGYWDGAEECRIGCWAGTEDCGFCYWKGSYACEEACWCWYVRIPKSCCSCHRFSMLCRRRTTKERAKLTTVIAGDTASKAVNKTTGTAGKAVNKTTDTASSGVNKTVGSATGTSVPRLDMSGQPDQIASMLPSWLTNRWKAADEARPS
jgi:hypothetical protein